MCLCVWVCECVCVWAGGAVGICQGLWAVKKKEGKSQIIFHVIRLVTSSQLWSPRWQMLCYWPERQLVISSTEPERCNCKSMRCWELRGADFSTAQTQASVANPLYSPINPHGCAHPVRTPVWACQHSQIEPWAELCGRYGHQPHYRHNQILLISSVRPQRLL